MSTTLINEECIKTCNSLLRGELSAVETYAKAIEKYPETPATAELTRIQSEHREVRKSIDCERDRNGRSS